MILIRPVTTNFPITQGFGENPDLYPATRGHNGIDYGLPEGSPVNAAQDGQVTRADLDAETALNPRAGYGIHVRIQAPGLLSIYGHLSKVEVKTGDWVKTGQVIGRAGNTGRSTGPHLHFEVRTGLALVNCIDPEPYIRDRLEDLAGLFMLELTQDGDGLRVRTSPPKGGVVRNLRQGDRVKVVGVTKGTWLQIEDGFIFYDPAWLKVVKYENLRDISKDPR